MSFLWTTSTDGGQPTQGRPRDAHSLSFDGDRVVEYLVRRVREGYPDLPIANVRAIESHGQNNAVLVVDEQIVFRFPGYTRGVVSLEREHSALSVEVIIDHEH